MDNQATLNNQPTFVNRFSAGINNVAAEYQLPEGALRDARNVDIDAFGSIRSRVGRTKLASLTNPHSLWSCEPYAYAYGVVDSNLCFIGSGGEITALKQLRNSKLRMNYCQALGYTYFSNGDECGVLKGLGGKPWGIETPRPVTVQSAGGFPLGVYQAAITYCNQKGEESAPSEPVQLLGNGIRLTNIPQPTESNVTAVRVYVSPHNGDVLYLSGELALRVTEFAPPLKPEGKMLETLNCQRVLPGTALCFYHGRFYFSIGSVVYFTRPFYPGVYQPDQDFFLFPDEITALGAAADGIYVGTVKRTYFLQGDDANKALQKTVVPYGVVAGTMTRIPGNAFSAELGGGAAEDVLCWWTTHGQLALGMASGGVRLLTENRLSADVGDTGFMFYREQDRLKQLITVFGGTQKTSTLAATDQVSVVVNNHGI